MSTLLVGQVILPVRGFTAVGKPYSDAEVVESGEAK